MAGIKSKSVADFIPESVADFIPESVADFAGIGTQRTSCLTPAGQAAFAAPRKAALFSRKRAKRFFVCFL